MKPKVEDFKQFNVLSWAHTLLEINSREKGVAEMLLQHHLEMDRTTFYMHMREEVSSDVWISFKRDIEHHIATGIPVQHLIGYEYFYGRKFSVNEHVLVPRMETEELVLHVLEQMGQESSPDLSIVDVGTGSGIIATTLALELPKATLLATDISKDALKTAKQNAANHEAAVTFYEGNFLQPLIDIGEEVDIVVSNPPYISWQDEPNLSDTVKNFDPTLALFADEDGLAAYKMILEQIENHLQEVKQIYFEIGYNQRQSIIRLAKQIFPDCEIKCLQDINEKDRIIAISL